MAGGIGTSFQSDSSSELVVPNGATRVNEDLSGHFWEHCVTKFNASFNIIIGGANSPKKTFLVHYKTFKMTKGEDLTGSGRKAHACAHIRHNNGSNYVIAAGGSSAGEYTDTSEILDVDNASNGWYPGINSHLSLIFNFNVFKRSVRFRCFTFALCKV